MSDCIGKLLQRPYMFSFCRVQIILSPVEIKVECFNVSSAFMMQNAWF